MWRYCGIERVEEGLKKGLDEVREMEKEILSAPSLAFRHYRCGRRICRSCEVKLDGKIVRACSTLLSPGGRYLLEPAHAEVLIKDLVFDFSAIFPE